MIINRFSNLQQGPDKILSLFSFPMAEKLSLQSSISYIALTQDRKASKQKTRVLENIKNKEWSSKLGIIILDVGRTFQQNPSLQPDIVILSQISRDTTFII